VDTAVLVVGPEGGFAPDERAAALAAGFLPRALGSHVLRTETAALVGAAVLAGLAAT
jgi:16S rRNA (uracil1498-N3)-methyltransferase